MAKKIEIDLGLSQSNLEALQVLSSLWRELEVLPEGVHKEYVWDECFTILSSLMRTC